MDKFGVDQSIDQAAMEKAATQGCPECGAKVTRDGSIMRCPVHGTEPFEQPKRE